jgi:hypothetical protein
MPYAPYQVIGYSLKNEPVTVAYTQSTGNAYGIASRFMLRDDVAYTRIFMENMKQPSAVFSKV